MCTRKLAAQMIERAGERSRALNLGLASPLHLLAGVATHFPTMYFPVLRWIKR